MMVVDLVALELACRLYGLELEVELVGKAGMGLAHQDATIMPILRIANHRGVPPRPLRDLALAL
jgi:hypothetical protein